MKLPIFQIDAFTSKIFSGNPAAVVPLEEWLPDSILQSIATENNLSETAFFVPEQSGYQLRWFTPVVEVNLCGHATLATAFVIFNYIDTGTQEIHFETLSGTLTVSRKEEQITLDFPARPATTHSIPPQLSEGLGKEPNELLLAEDFLAVFSSEKDILEMQPNFHLLKQLNSRGVIVTARGEKADFVSRFFAPAVGIDEDPVTGSAHCTLTPYWNRVLNKSKLKAHQLSKRGGELYCEYRKDRIFITGRAVKFLKGTIEL